MSFAMIDHFVLQIIVNRIKYDPSLSSLHPFYQINPSIDGFWISSFPNNNVVISSVVILLPILFGDRSRVFKWIMGIISGLIILSIGFFEIGGSHAWFTDVFASIGLVLFWSWFFYWHVLFIKDSESKDLEDKLTRLYSRAYNTLLEAKTFFNEHKTEECRSKLLSAREQYNQSISSIQNISRNTYPYLKRNEFWKFNVNQLLKELDKVSPSTKKWMYIF
jgi:hypothetical protein